MWKSMFFRFCCFVSCFIYRVLAGIQIIAIVFLSFLGIANAQQSSSVLEPLSVPEIGEYRSLRDGNWNDAATWQEWTGVEWLSASTFPSESSRRAPLVASWNTSIKTGEGRDHEIALPDGIEAGDLLLIFWTGAEKGGAIATLPSGFTRLYSATSSLRDRITWYKVANGTEGQTINIRAGTGASAHITYRIAAGTYDGIPVAIKSPITGSNSTPDPPALNPDFGAVPTLWIAASHSDGDISTFGPSDYPVPIVAYTGSEDNEGARTATAHIITTNAISQDPATFNLDSSRNWAANTIAIQGASRKAIIQNNHTVKLSNDLTVSDVDVFGTLDVNTNTAMFIHDHSTLTVRAGGRLRLPGNNTAGNDARIAGAGNFTLSEGAYLEIGSRYGITSSGMVTTSGNIRNANSGERIFHPGAHYIYNRIGLVSRDQSTGTGYPDNLTGSLTIDNPGVVTRTGASRIITTGTVYLLQGTFAVGNSGFTVGNNRSSPNSTIVRSGGILTGRVGNNLYNIVYEGDSKTTGPELLGGGLHSITVDLQDKNQVLTLNQNTTVPGTLTLNMGLVNTSSHTLTVSNMAIDAISGGSSDSFVEGNLIRAISSGVNTYNFPLGSGGRYASVVLDFTRNTTNREVTGFTKHSNHTDIASSSLKGSKVERHWTFLATGTGTYNYNPTFSWDNADEEDGFDSKGSILARYNGSTWTYPTMLDRTVSSVTATGLTELGDFQVGSEDMRPDAGKSTIKADRTSDVVANNIDMSTITVTVHNANGNPVSAGVDVFFKVTSGRLGDGGLDPLRSWKTNEDGQVVVNLTSTVANSVGVQAYLGTDETGEWIGGTEVDAIVEVTFNAGEATHLAIATQPIIGGASGSAIIGQPVIYILDANDNIVIDDITTEVTVTIFSGDGGSLSGMASIIADGGVVRFYDLALSGIVGETYRLNFASDGLRMAVSDDVILSSHGSVGQVVLSGLTTDLPSGDSRVLTVTLKDVAGNIVDTGEESFFEVIFSQNGGSGSVSGLNAIAAEDGIAIITLIGEKAGQVNVRVSTVSPALVDELSFTITVDKSELQAAIDATIDLIETDWTVDSWTTLQNVITEARLILDDTAATQLEIDIALANLEDTLAALDVDKSTLSTVISEAITKIEVDWSPASWGVFAAALANGEGVLVDVESTQLEIDIALATLSTAIAELAVDKTALQIVVTKTEDLVETDWSVDSWMALQTAIEDAKDVLDDISATQSEVNHMFTVLDSTFNALGIDKGALSTVISEAITKIKEHWSPASWGVFAAALANAEDVLADVESTQLEVDIALATLSTAIAELSVDKTALQAAVIKTEDLVEADWSVDSWSVLQNAITEAKSILDNTVATQLEIDTVLAILNAAIAGLELVVSNITGIKDDLPILETVYGIAFEDIDDLKDLPLSLMVSLSSGDSELVEVKWEAGDYNPVVLGEYTILGQLVLPADPAFTNVNDLMAEVKVTVNPKPLTITADNRSKFYGQADPVLTYTLSATLIGDDAFTGALARTAGEDVGEYVIGQGTLALSDNYDLSFVPGRLTIQKAGQHIEFREVGRLLRDVGQVELEVSSDSGLPVGLHSSDELVATIVGGDLLVHRLGTTRITATQEGDKNHEPAEPVTITVTVEDATDGDPVRIHPALSPNGDGINDFLILEGIKDYPDNKLTILTRNGIRVFTIDNYDNDSRVFKGIGNFNSSGGTLPQGTYFYMLEYKDGQSWKVKKGWFVLKM